MAKKIELLAHVLACVVYIPVQNIGIFNFPHMIKFANFEFIFAIRGPKLARRHEEIYNFRGSKYWEIYTFIL